MTSAPVPLLDLSKANSPETRHELLKQLREALYHVGFLYIKNHGVPQHVISGLTSRLPALFNQPSTAKAAISKINSPHFLGYNGYAQETTLGEKDLREQFDFATELPVVYDPSATTTIDGRNFSKLYWRLRGPNQWPDETRVPGFRTAFTQSDSASPQGTIGR